MATEINLIKNWDAKKSKLENIALFIQIIATFITIGLLIYWFNSYKFEKKIEYTNLFITKLETSLDNYWLFLLSENVKVNMYNKKENWLQPCLDRIYEIQIANTENFISFKNYLNLSSNLDNNKYLELLDERFTGIQNKFQSTTRRMFNEVNESWKTFNNFSTWTFLQINSLEKEINDFSNDIIYKLK
jgi:hypothetical protein